MATTLTGARIENLIVWKNDNKSMRASFKALDKYKSKVDALKNQMASVGKVKLKIEGLSQAKAQINQLKTAAAKASKASGGSVGVGAKSGLFGPPKPPVQGVVKQTAARAKESAAEQKRLDDWLSNAHKASIKEEANLKKESDNRRKERLQAYAKQQREADNKTLAAKKAQSKEAKRLESIYSYGLSSAMQKLNKEQREFYLNQLKISKGGSAYRKTLAKVKSDVRAINKMESDRLRLMNKQNFAQRRAVNSMQQLVGGAVSVYTALQGIGSVFKTGMDIQRIEATLSSVSETPLEAKANMKFLSDETLRMGTSLVDSGKAFAKILAARGKLPLEEAKNLFTSISEAGVVAGTSTAELSLQVKSLSQMLGKTTVMSEELKTQLGDTMPIALEVFAKAAKDAGLSGGSIPELFKLMEKGLLSAVKVMPHVSKGFKEFAHRNGAFEKAMKNSAKRTDVMFRKLEEFRKMIFLAGGEKGLGFLLNGFDDLYESAKTLAGFLGGALEGSIKGLVFPFRFLYAVVHDVTKALGWHDSETGLEWITSATKEVTKLAGTLISLVGILWGVKKAFGLLKGAGRMIGNIGGSSGKSGSGGKASKGGSGLMGKLGVQKVFVTNMGAGGMEGALDSSGKGKGKFGKYAKMLGAGLLSAEAIIPLLLGGTVVGLSEAIKATKDPITQRSDFAAQAFGVNNPQAMNYTSQKYGIMQPTYAAPQQKVAVEVNVKHDSEMFNSQVKTLSNSESSYQTWTDY